VSQPDHFAASLTDGRMGADRLVAVQRRGLRAVWVDPGRVYGERVALGVGTAEPAEVPADLAELANSLGPEARQHSGSAAQLPADLAEALRALGYAE
jgi:hypothetical protein